MFTSLNLCHYRKVDWKSFNTGKWIYPISEVTCRVRGGMWQGLHGVNNGTGSPVQVLGGVPEDCHNGSSPVTLEGKSGLMQGRVSWLARPTRWNCQPAKLAVAARAAETQSGCSHFLCSFIQGDNKIEVAGVRWQVLYFHLSWPCVALYTRFSEVLGSGKANDWSSGYYVDITLPWLPYVIAFCWRLFDIYSTSMYAMFI